MPVRLFATFVVAFLFALGPLCGPAAAEDALPPEDASLEAEIEAARKENLAEETRESEEERAARRANLYLAGDYRIAPPGGRARSNFYLPSGFRTVNSNCYAGVVNLEMEGSIPLAPGAKYNQVEQIRFRPTRSTSFVQRYRWEAWSDPFEIMGVASSSEGSGGGTARVALALDMSRMVYRLVTDVRPRMDFYRITTTSAAGPGRVTDEDLYFAFADHHYSYIDLSGFAAMRGVPVVEQAIAEIEAIASSRPPNVFMGFFDWAYDDEGYSEGELRIYDTDRARWALGTKGEAEREISVRIFCPDLIRQFESRWGPG